MDTTHHFGRAALSGVDPAAGAQRRAAVAQVRTTKQGGCRPPGGSSCRAGEGPEQGRLVGPLAPRTAGVGLPAAVRGQQGRSLGGRPKSPRPSRPAGGGGALAQGMRQGAWVALAQQQQLASAGAHGARFSAVQGCRRNRKRRDRRRNWWARGGGRRRGRCPGRRLARKKRKSTKHLRKIEHLRGPRGASGEPPGPPGAPEDPRKQSKTSDETSTKHQRN